MKITHQKGRGTKVHILLDGEYTVTTDENFWMDNFIPNDTEISEEEWEELLKKIYYKKALNKCADYLSRRDHSVKELRDKLLRSVDFDSAQKAINRYIEAGYLDDTKYCEHLAEYFLKEKKYSVRRVKQECYKRGISRGITDNVLSKMKVDSVNNICELLTTKYKTKLEQENGKEKVIASLMRNGYYFEDIKSAFYRLEENDE